MKTSHGPGRVSLPRAISKLGFASRSQAVRLILSGNVSVNTRVELNPHRWVDLERDAIEIDNRALKPQAFRYILLHKPGGFVTTRVDEHGKRTVFELLGERGEGLSAVGRLDKDTTGFLLFTNDHQLANRLTSPDSGVQKTYVAALDRPLEPKDLSVLSEGVDIQLKGTRHRTKSAVVIQKDSAETEISITEGKNRQIRRMLGERGYEVQSLRRISLGPLELGNLAEGDSRELSANEVADLRESVGLTRNPDTSGQGRQPKAGSKSRREYRKSDR